MKKLLDIDLIAGVVSITWAILCVYVVGLCSIVSPQAAGGFAVLALGRWYNKVRSQKKA